ncbi:MAG: hypothetical protein IPM14_05345 [bacterium]|nr:hypothetical protein [bacterium]
MKNQTILWLGSLVVIFLIGYIKSITDKDYPVTGTFGIEGYKVSYKLDKVTHEKLIYKNIVISDIKGVSGKIIWFHNNKRFETEMVEIDRGVTGDIPVLKPGQKINYKIVLEYKNKTYEIPKNDLVTLTFWGNVPSAIKILHFIILYGGMLLAIRSAFELFNQNKNLKKYFFITSSLFLILTIIINPLRNSYKLGALNNFVPPVLELLEPIYLILSLLWITGTMLIFIGKYKKTVAVITTFATIIIFFLL